MTKRKMVADSLPQRSLDRVTRWSSRHRKPVVASLLVAALGLVGFAICTALISAEKTVSDANAQQAENSEQLARGAVDRLGSQMAELLSAIPAAEQVRRHLLSETLDYYETFAATALVPANRQRKNGRSEDGNSSTPSRRNGPHQ